MAYLLFAVVASAVGIAAVLLRNRRPTTMQSSIGEFERGLRALAPVPGEGPAPGAGEASDDGAGSGEGADADRSRDHVIEHDDRDGRDGRDGRDESRHESRSHAEPGAGEAHGQDPGAGRSG
ncbi:MAG: hypothetical protein M5T61_08800 [Acidimicrobiia bacterium]|nr:hypothetical protein [Acidimicrobiia bacterium]